VVDSSEREGKGRFACIFSRARWYNLKRDFVAYKDMESIEARVVELIHVHYKMGWSMHAGKLMVSIIGL
jgi:hypothetical protein